MKFPLLKFTLLLIVLVGGLCACQDDKDNLFIEISPNSQSQVIEQEIDGITFKFCLLNEQGQPATVFKEGENIIFNFSIENNLEKTISFPTLFINDEFYRVYRNDHTDMGKAWTGTWCEFVQTDRIIELPPHEEKQLKCPWFLYDDFQSSQVDYPLCKGESMEPLPRGEYSTTLDFDFPYTEEEKQKSIKDMTFKINFQIR